MISSTDEVKQRPIVEELDRLPDVLNAEGYIIVQTGIERKLLESVIDDIFEHTGTSRHDPESWYRADTIRAHAGMAEMYHYQSMWDIRQHPALYEIFQAVHVSPRLWVSLDRVAMKPPARRRAPGVLRRWFHTLGRGHKYVPRHPIFGTGGAGPG